MSRAVRNLFGGGAGSTEGNATMDKMTDHRHLDADQQRRDHRYADAAAKHQIRGMSTGALQMLPFFPGLTVDDLPDREGWASEVVTLSTHMVAFFPSEDRARLRRLGPRSCDPRSTDVIADVRSRKGRSQSP
jgi:hypothetical protein